MSKVEITKTLLDDLADTIAAESGVQAPMSIPQMTEAIGQIRPPNYTGSYRVTPTENSVVLETSGKTMTDNVIIEGVETGGGVTITETQDSHGGTIVTITTDGDVTPIGPPTLQTKTAAYTPTESQQTATITADSGYDGLDEVDITVDAISSTYVGSGITRRSSSDLTASGATVTAPAGYYASQASKSVASGTAGTPTATKGTVSNHQVSVTPSVTNTTGYITGSTKTGTAVTVSASELVSGTYTVDSTGTKDVTNYASASIPAGSLVSNIEYVDDEPSITVDSSGVVHVGGGYGGNIHPVSTGGWIDSSATIPTDIGVSGTYQLSTQSATTITPTESEQVAVDANKYTTGQVKVGAISSTYVGSGITRRSASDLTRNAYTVTAPAGYYPEAVSKNVERTTHATPAVSINESTGLITATHSQDQGWVEGSGSGADVTSKTLQLTTQAATTITPTTSAQTAVAAGKYTTGAVTVAAMPTGTAGTPTATKGTVSNHSVSVTPSVTNTAGYITGGTKTGTAVSVSASELVSGTLTISASGTHDVTNYASASVASGGATASATKGTVSNHSVTVTPSVTRTAGYVTAGTASGTAVTVSASELVSGSETKTANGTYNVTNLAELVVAIPIQHYYTGSSAPSSSLGEDGDIYLKTS